MNEPSTAVATRPSAVAGTIKYRPEIEGLRGLAVLPILLFHAGVPGFGGGYVGVDVFYVISGYLITGIIAPQISGGRFSLLTFYDRRVRRIAPAAAVLLAATAIAASFILMPADMLQFGRSLVATVFFSSNIFFFKEAGYFDGPSVLKPLLHTWSLGVEEQFYLFYPLTLIIAARLAPKHLLAILIAAAFASFALSVWLIDVRPEAAFYLLPPRAWELLVGGILWVARLPRPSRPVAETSTVAGIALILIAVFTFSARTVFPGWAAVVPCAGSLLIIYGGAGTLSSCALTMAPMRFLGRISYSLYLWHWPVMAFYRYRFDGEPGALMKALLIGGMIAAAALSWRFVEEPFRTRKLLSRRALLFGGTGSAALILAGCGAALVSTGGWPTRYPPAVAEKEAFANERDWSRTCTDPLPAAVRAGRLCVLGVRDGTPDTLIWGDSQARFFDHLYDRALVDVGQSAYLASRNGCPPLPGVRRLLYGAPCDAFSTAALELIQAKKLKRVIFVAAWPSYFTDAVVVDSSSPDTSEKSTAEAINRHFDALIRYLRSQRIEVYIQDPLPGTRIPPPRALAQQLAYGGTGPDMRWSRPEFLRRAGPYFDMVDRNRSLISGRIMLWPELCRSGYCDAVRGGKPLYWDGAHPSKSNFYFAVASIEPILRRYRSVPAGLDAPSGQR